MNGPLTVISGFTQLLDQRIGKATQVSPHDLEFIQSGIKTITRQVTNCIEISRRYLSFLRDCPDEGSRVGINQLLIDLSHLANVHPTRKLNELAIRPLLEDVFVRMNGTDFLQILLNLTVNAFQCLDEPHTVEIHSWVLTEPVDLKSFKDGPQDRLLNVEKFDNTPPLLKISVRDTGPGIPAETLPKIFQAYFTTKGPDHGTGLGLNIVQRLIKEAKGALHLHTEVGKGTTFTAYLPALSLNGG
jgi:signal transduction histidine kinase